MFSFKVLGMDLYYFLNCFFIYSFLGWIMECIVIYVEEKELVNRGFIKGPLCTIYGAGALGVYFLLGPLQGNVIYLFLLGSTLATLFEYITAKLMIYLFGDFWWDYSNKPLNYKGILCLESTIAWGFLVVFLFLYIHPFVEFIISLYPVSVGKVLVSIVSFLYCVDFSTSFYKAYEKGKYEEIIDDEFDSENSIIEEIGNKMRKC